MPVINGATASDIYQGSLGNCGQMAALAGAARVINLASRIKYQGNGWYTVALYSALGGGLHNVSVYSMAL